jgi:predicted nucleic acid-binding Zn ribbon protein
VRTRTVLARPYTPPMPWEPLPDSHDRDPAPMAPSLDRVVRRLGGPSADVATGVFGRWAELVGDAVAANTRPLSMHGSTLVVAVSDPAWATQLRFLEVNLVERLQAELGVGTIDAIEVRVRPEQAR